MDSIDFRLAVSELERSLPEIRGKRVRDVPELGGWRTKFVRDWSRLAIANFAAAAFNVVVVSGSAFPWAAFNVVAAAVSTYAMIFCELRHAATRRQLNRSAAEQLVRDMNGMKG